MSLNPDSAEQERIAQAAERRRARVERRERILETAFAAGFVAAAAALLLLAGAPASGIHPIPAAACIVCFAIAVHVPFAVGEGYTVPTQLAFVPLLFTLPPALAPWAVLAGLLLARLPGQIAGRRPLARLVFLPGDAWFAIGPAAVLAAAGAPPADHLALPVAAGAIGAQCAVEIAAWIVREGPFGRAGVREQIRELWVHGVDLALTPVALVVALVIADRPWSVFALMPLIGVLAVFAREREARLQGLFELNQAYHGTALLLGDVVEADDSYTGTHSRGVVSLAMDVGAALGLDAAQRRNLEFAALLHDVGKVAIPKAIINKPGKLDPAESTVIKTHTLEGQRMLDRVGGFMRSVGLIVRSHHEQWDGGGYPDGLAGEAIPLEARIIACCDAWSAMTTTRSYREAMPVTAAAAEIRRCTGTQFDPRVADALLAIVLDAPDAGAVRAPVPQLQHVPLSTAAAR